MADILLEHEELWAGVEPRIEHAGSASLVADSESGRYELRVDVLVRNIVIARLRVEPVRRLANSYREPYS